MRADRSRKLCAPAKFSPQPEPSSLRVEDLANEEEAFLNGADYWVAETGKSVGIRHLPSHCVEVFVISSVAEVFPYCWRRNIGVLRGQAEAVELAIT